MNSATSTVSTESRSATSVQMGDISMTFQVRAQETIGGVAVHEWELGPHKIAAPPHRHEHEDEVFYVLDGEVTLMQDDEVTTASPGRVVVLPRGHFHTFWNEGDVPLRMLVILSPGRLENYFEQAGQLLRPGVAPDMMQLGRLSQQYGLTLQPERMPQLMAKYRLQSEVPPPAPPQ